jgi:predicted transcriptional regulator
MCIEDFAVCDIGSLMKKYPEEFELSQHIMHQLAKKIENLVKVMEKKRTDDEIVKDIVEDIENLGIAPKERVPEGCRKTCSEKIIKYLENKTSCKVSSLVNRFPKFSEDEIKSALARLVVEQKIRKLSNDEIEVIR